MRAVIAALVLVLAACEGPTGPEGPPGPEGDPGPGTWSHYEGRLNSTGGALVEGIPGTEDALPLIDCYTRGSPSNFWSKANSCDVAEGGPSTLMVAVTGPANGYYQVVVVHP